MVSGSNDYKDIKVWIENIIGSCKTYEQTLVAKNLVDLFIKQIRKNHVDASTVWSIESKLEYQLWSAQHKLTNF
jgi:hypothetical protein